MRISDHHECALHLIDKHEIDRIPMEQSHGLTSIPRHANRETGDGHDGQDGRQFLLREDLFPMFDHRSQGMTEQNTTANQQQAGGNHRSDGICICSSHGEEA